jgi:hypothetical protein
MKTKDLTKIANKHLDKFDLNYGVFPAVMKAMKEVNKANHKEYSDKRFDLNKKLLEDKYNEGFRNGELYTVLFQEEEILESFADWLLTEPCQLTSFPKKDKWYSFFSYLKKDLTAKEMANKYLKRKV